MISNNLNITNTLINAGADLNTKDISGLTPLDFGNYFVFEIFLKINNLFSFESC